MDLEWARGAMPTERRADRLNCSERLLLAGLRVWVGAFKERRCGLPAVLPILRRFDAVDAAPPLHAFLLQVATAARRAIDIRPCCCVELSEDEALLLTVVGLLQYGRVDAAMRRLDTCLAASAMAAATIAASRLADALRSAGREIPVRQWREAERGAPHWHPDRTSIGSPTVH